jgi:hypothetical protein
MSPLWTSILRFAFFVSDGSQLFQQSSQKRQVVSWNLFWVSYFPVSMRSPSGGHKPKCDPTWVSLTTAIASIII